MTPARAYQIRRGIHLARSPFGCTGLETTLTQHAYAREQAAIVKRAIRAEQAEHLRRYYA